MSEQTKEVKIAAKTLAQLNMPDFCPRCFWIKHNIKKLPFQTFPGIFSSIDAYTKRVMHTWFDKHGEAPPWLPVLDGVTGYLKVPHWSKFKLLDDKTGITVSGVMDDLFSHKGGTYIIPDYKTAKFTASQDKLFPLYQAQLNGYRWIHEGLTGETVSSLPMIYCEPQTSNDDCEEHIYRDDGFMMGFKVHVIQAEISDRLIPAMLSLAKDIIEMPQPPHNIDDCKDCENLDNLIDIMGG